MKVKVINSCVGKWYRVGEVYVVKDASKYEPIGIQVFNSDTENKHPDVIMNGDYKYL